MAKLIVKRKDGEPIGFKHSGTLGGEEIWTISAASSGAQAPLVRSVTMRFDAMDAAVNDYAQSEEETTVSLFQPIMNKATFHWTREGAVNVTVSAMVAGQPVSRTIAVKVVAPAVLEFTGTTSQSSLVSEVRRGREAHAANETDWRLEFKAAGKAGAAFHAKVSIPCECDGGDLFFRSS